MHILIADDDDGVRAVLKLYLQKYGLDITLCSGVAAALEKLSRGIFDLVLTDFLMQDGDGRSVIAAAKKYSPDAKILLMSSDLDGVPLDVRRQADHTLLKPELLGSLAAILKMFGVPERPVIVR